MEEYIPLDPIEILKPIFETWCLHDLLPLIRQFLDQLVSSDKLLNNVGRWPVEYSRALDENAKYMSKYNSRTTMVLNSYEKILLSRKIMDKYHDFDDIIWRTSGKMHDEFQESGKSKLYAAGAPDQLTLKNFRIDGTKLRFTIIVGEDCKGKNYYYMSAGNFFVEWF